MKREKKGGSSQKCLEEQLYIIGLIALPVMLVSGALFLGFISPKLEFGCIFRAVTGFYCPGCGGTRALLECAHGHFLRAMWYHPFVVYSLALYLAFMISHTFAKIISGIRGIRFHAWYLYGALAILIMNWVIKNILYFYAGVEI